MGGVEQNALSNRLSREMLGNFQETVVRRSTVRQKKDQARTMTMRTERKMGREVLVLKQNL